MLKRSLTASGSYCCVLKQWRCMTQVKVVKASHEVRCLSGLASQLSRVTSENIKINFRTPETDPLKHTIQDEGLYYTVPQTFFNKFVKPGAHVGYNKLMNTFQEKTIMVRKPALELFNLIDNLNLNHPPLRIVLYGKPGSGKTMTMAHVIHRYVEQDWVIVSVPWVGLWIRYVQNREVSKSLYRPGRIDHTKEAVEWLKMFYVQNEKHVGNLQTTKEYTWTVKEKTEAGVPVTELVEFGINRQKFASDCVGAILRELRMAASDKQIKVLVAIDGINGLWREADIRLDKKKFTPASDLTLIHNFKKMLMPTWSNGVVLSTVDSNISRSEFRELDTPYYLLGKEGFEAMDPFLPVLVPEYSDKEVYSCLEYYIDRMWIQRPKGKTSEGKLELISLSNKNPKELMLLSAQW